MKKILFTILAAAAMSAACTQFAEDLTPAYDTVGKPEVVADVADDDSITVVITAGENTSYYGYAVVKDTLVGVTAEKLVADGYSKDPAAVLQGEEQIPQTASIKYSEETKSVTLQLTGLVPFTNYTVYAAAISPMGVPSAVVAVTVRTTDGTEPALTAVDFAEKEDVLTFTISFNDPVSLTGNGTAKATFYGENYYDATGALIIYKEVDIPADSISTSGKNLVVAVPASEYIPGAYVAVTYSAGIVKNGADAVNAAYENRIIGYDAQGAIQKKGIFGYYDYANWDFSLVDPATLPDDPEGGDEMEGEDEEEEEKIPVYFNDWTQLVMPTYGTTAYGIVTDTEDTKIRVSVLQVDGKIVSYDAAANKFAAIGENVLGLMLNEDPTFGASISYTIAEGSFADLFGNVNNEFTAEDEYYSSYGYTVDDIIGEYTISGINLWLGAPMTYPMVIAASDEAEYGNVMITNYFGIEGKLYCDFNIHTGMLFIDEGDIFAEGYATFFNGAGNQTFTFAPGTISHATAYVIVAAVKDNSMTGYAKDADGVNIGVANFVATLNE